MKKYILLTTLFCFLLAACQGQQYGATGAQPVLLITTPGPGQNPPVPLSPTKVPTAKPSPSTAPSKIPVMPTITMTAPEVIPQTGVTGKVPNFDHIIMTVLENEDYSTVIGNTQMPQLNALAKKYVTLSNYFAVSHPSLPNYISLMSGDTQGITSDCTKCFIKSKKYFLIASI